MESEIINSNEKIEIDSSEVKFIGPNRDDVGRVFFWNNCVFRAIHSISVDKVK